MTRETKIGLLVGLAFILVVGILLSEHITGASDRPAAPLAEAGHGVSRGVSAPGAATDETRVLEPVQPVPTPADLTLKPAVTHVAVVVPPVPAGGQSTVVIPDNNGQTPEPTPAPTPAPAKVQPTPPSGQSTIVIHAPIDPFSNDPVAKIAKKMGEPVVPVSPSGKATDPAVKTVANTTAAREYKAQAGDTLSRLAALLPGGNVKANRDAVVALNPTLQKDPNRIVSGRAYLLPTAGAIKSAAQPAPQIAVVVPVKPTPKADADTTDAASRTYVVKPGDTLSKIASNEMGSKAELPTLRKLNADVLKGSDVIKVDMKLKLPAAKMMASIR